MATMVAQGPRQVAHLVRHLASEHGARRPIEDAFFRGAQSEEVGRIARQLHQECHEGRR